MLFPSPVLHLSCNWGPRRFHLWGERRHELLLRFSRAVSSSQSRCRTRRPARDSGSPERPPAYREERLPPRKAFTRFPIPHTTPVSNVFLQIMDFSALFLAHIKKIHYFCTPIRYPSITTVERRWNDGRTTVERKPDNTQTAVKRRSHFIIT